MTKQYAVGDEVLVRGTVIEVDEDDVDRPFRIEACRAPIWSRQNEIYGPAPEFNYGEEIEVSGPSLLQWFTEKFEGYVQGANEPWITTNKNKCIMSWQYARKKQKPEDDILIKDGVKYRLVKVEK